MWDLGRQAAVIPLTRVTADPPGTALAEGVGFTGRTGIGPVGFDDPMRVLVWEQPGEGAGRAVISKTGSVIGGRIEVGIVPWADGSRVTWCQYLELPWLPSPLSVLERLVARVVAPGYRMVLRRLLAQP